MKELKDSSLSRVFSSFVNLILSLYGKCLMICISLQIDVGIILGFKDIRLQVFSLRGMISSFKKIILFLENIKFSSNIYF